MAFRVGQDVLCVNDAGVTQWLKKGEIYTVASVFEFYAEWFLALEGVLDNKASNGFWLHRFRPLTRRNIEIVESLKAPPPADLGLEPLRPEEVAFQ